MNLFGLDEAEVAGLIRQISRDEPDSVTIRERFALAAWSCIAEPGDRHAGALLRSFGAAEALHHVLIAAGIDTGSSAAASPLPATDASWRSALERWRPRLRSMSVLHAVREAARLRVRMLTRLDEDWPSGLDDLGDHGPIVLWTRGRAAMAEALANSFALVGARAATGYGEHITAEAAAGLADRGFAIVSGAAYGIDGVAHRVALASGATTVAFLAGGVDRPYPSGHEALISRIIAHGAVAAEVPCGTAPTRWRFLQRNRLIAAATQATVVLEAGHRSGSLNTAGHAATLGRPLGAVPGPVTSPASAGCHRLIREYDALLVTTADEMAALHPNWVTTGTAEREHTSDPETTRLLDGLSTRAARGVSDIAVRTGLTEAEVRRGLALLELEGRAMQRDDGDWLRSRMPRGAP